MVVIPTMKSSVCLKTVILLFIAALELSVSQNVNYCAPRAKVTMSEAIVTCSSLGMRLAQPTTIGSWNRLVEVRLREFGSYETWVHIRRESSGSWVWGDGITLEMGIWSLNPKNIPDNNKLCAKIKKSELWYADCAEKKRAACEFDEDSPIRWAITNLARVNEVPIQAPMEILPVRYPLMCTTRCMENPTCISYVITDELTCQLYDSLATSGVLNQMGAAFYVQPKCLTRGN